MLLNILQDSSFSNQITFILHIQGVFSLPGRGFHQRVTLISSVPMTLDDVIVHVRQFIKGLQKEKSITIPIVDYTQTIAYRVSRELANILQPLVGKTEHHTENSQELVKEMTKLTVGEGESFVSYDVVSLFTKTPIKERAKSSEKGYRMTRH